VDEQEMQSGAREATPSTGSPVVIVNPASDRGRTKLLRAKLERALMRGRGELVLTDGRRAAEKLAATAHRLAQSLGIAQLEFPLGKTGGTIGRSQFFDHALDLELRNRLTQAAIVRVSVEAAETAARLALRNLASRKEAGR